MNPFRFISKAASLTAAIAFSGCAMTGSNPVIGTAPATAGRAAHGERSWMAPGVAAQDLLYVSNGNGIVNVYRYWQHDLVGELIDFTQPQGECADAKGDVYVTDYSAGDIDEYAHAGKTALRVIDESGYNPYACAIDPKTGDLAVANFGKGGYYTQGSVAIYKHASGKPRYYSSKDLYHVNGVAYDNYGDLLATGYYLYSSYWVETYFAYLPAKSKSLGEISLPPPNSSGWFGVQVAGVEWDGKYWIVDLYGALYQYSINIKPELVGSVTIDGGDDPVAFYFADSKKQATQAVSGYFFENDDYVEYYKYPSGGEPYAMLTHGLYHPFGVAISLRD